MNISTPEQVYPFATADGKDIPFDVVKPVGVRFISFSLADWVECPIPLNAQVVSIYSKNPCLASFSAIPPSLDLSTYFPATLFIPGQHIVHCAMPSNKLYVLGIEAAGTAVFQFVTRWAALALPRQFEKK